MVMTDLILGVALALFCGSAVYFAYKYFTTNKQTYPQYPQQNEEYRLMELEKEILDLEHKAKVSRQFKELAERKEIALSRINDARKARIKHSGLGRAIKGVQGFVSHQEAQPRGRIKERKPERRPDIMEGLEKELKSVDDEINNLWNP